LDNGLNRSWPVGSLKPNDLGLFDMHGNVYCWCQERGKHYVMEQGGRVTHDDDEGVKVIDKENRVFRGGSFYCFAVGVRSASRGWLSPLFCNFDTGLRPARTFAP
jgi:formylglycine-generating enzyme required for sulfatase activity